MTRTRSVSLGLFALLGLFGTLSATSVRAHEFGSAASGHVVAVPFVAVLLLSAGVGTVAGLLVLARSDVVPAFRATTKHRLATLFGLVLVGLGASVLVPVSLAFPGLAVLGVVLGTLAGWRLPHHSTPVGSEAVSRASTVGGALTAHRLVEGVALAALYTAGDALGVVAVLLLSVHNAVETGAVGVEYATVGRRRSGMAAVLGMQTAYVLAALGGILAAVSLPTPVRVLAVTAVAGILLAVGSHEVRTHVTGTLPVANSLDVER